MPPAIAESAPADSTVVEPPTPLPSTQRLTQASTFATRYAGRDHSPRPRQMLSLGEHEEWQSNPTKGGRVEKITLEALVDLDSRATYRRYKQDPQTLYPNYDPNEGGDIVLEEIVVTAEMRGPTDRYGESAPDKITPRPTPK